MPYGIKEKNARDEMLHIGGDSYPRFIDASAETGNVSVDLTSDDVNVHVKPNATYTVTLKLPPAVNAPIRDFQVIVTNTGNNVIVTSSNGDLTSLSVTLNSVGAAVFRCTGVNYVQLA